VFKLVIADDEGKTTVVPLVRDEITIGRKEGNTIRLTERNISRRHAKLTKSNGSFLLQDLNSYNGVRINGQRVEAETSLNAGDQIHIGDYTIALQLEGHDVIATEPTRRISGPPPGEIADAPTAMIAMPSEPPPPTRLVMVSPPAPGAEFAITRSPVRIGRAEDLDVWINHRSISREHAEITSTDGEYRIRDLESANGMRVNGKNATEATLAPGDLVELGQVRFRFIGRGEAYALDADRTLQVEPMAAASTSKGPYMYAAAILVTGVIVGVWLAISPPATPHAANPPREPVTGVPTAPSNPPPSLIVPPANEDAEVAELVSQCEASVTEGRFARALEHAAAALARVPGSEPAQRCKELATGGELDQEHFDQARRAHDAGDVDQAYALSQGLAADSALRSEPEFSAITNLYAERHLAAARLARDSDVTRREAQLVLAIPAVEPRWRRQAEQLLARPVAPVPPVNVAGARDAGTTVAINQTPTPPDTPLVAPARPEDPLRTCFAQDPTTDALNRCIIRSLGGQARTATARELDALINAYGQTGNGAARIRTMRQYVQRFQGTPKARAFEQILAQTPQ